MSTVAEFDSTAMEHPFIQAVIRLTRAEDSYGAWEGKSDHDLIAPYILTKEERKALPLIGDPSPRTLARLHLFYAALSMVIGEKTGIITSPVIQMHHEGFGRVVLTTGRLVVLSRHLRDVHRFGFPSLEKFIVEAEKHISKAVELIETYPEVAKD
jgi:probable nitrogen fixation protein